jgi:hypothetical protein
MRWASLGALLLAACAHTPKGPASKTPVVLWMERQGCYGECPIYRVTLYRDGTVQYDGEEYVKVKGRRIGHVDPATFGDLAQRFADADWAHATDFKAYDCTDLPTVLVSFDAKTIEHYWGDSKAPEALGELEAQIDGYLHTEDWVGAPGGPFAYMCY